MMAISTDQMISLIWNEPSPYSSRKCETWTSAASAIVCSPGVFLMRGEAYGSRALKESGNRAQRVGGGPSLRRQRPSVLLAQRAEHRLRRQRQLGQPHADRVVDGVGDSRRQRHGRGLADALGAERRVVLERVDRLVDHRRHVA